MAKSFSIAQARHQLAALVHQLEHQSRIQLTRRGKPVAVLLSMREYNRITAQSKGFWDAYAAYIAATDLRRLNIEPQIFEGLRDKTFGREVKW